jgi:Flp pilus assembly protein TadG
VAGRRRAGGGRPRHRLSSLARRDQGALTLSYLIIVPVFMLLVMVIVQAAMWYLASEAALAAARQGADAARLPGAAAGAGPQAAIRFAHSSASGYLLDPAATANGSTPTTVQVTVCGHVPTFVPGLKVTVSQAVQAPVEQFAVPAGSTGPTGGAGPLSARTSSPALRAAAPAQCPGGGG